MREIEVKYRVDDLEGLLAALKCRGIDVSDPLHQDDQAYAPAGWQFGDSKLGVSFLRLRTVAGRHYFTLKQPAQNDQACLEYETEVTDREAMHHAALHMGYRPMVRIVKTGPDGEPVLLEQQDRARWDYAAIRPARAVTRLERAVALCGNERERAVLRRKITCIANRG